MTTTSIPSSFMTNNITSSNSNNNHNRFDNLINKYRTRGLDAVADFLATKARKSNLYSNLWVSIIIILTNCFVSVASKAERHTWYCSGKCSVTYSLIVHLACSRRYWTSEVIAVLDTCNLEAISWWVIPLTLISTTLFLYFLFAAVKLACVSLWILGSI